MSDLHLSPADLSGYIQGALVADRAAMVEAHSVDCDACAEALAREARFERALEHVASRPEARSEPVMEPAARRRTPFGSAMAAMALAASIALFFAGRAAGQGSREAPRPETSQGSTGGPGDQMVADASLGLADKLDGG